METKLFDKVVRAWRKPHVWSKFVAVIGCATSILVLRLITKKVTGKMYKYPPQLYGLPIIGSLLTMQIYKGSFLLDLIPSYGDLVRYNVGGVVAHHINNAELVKKVFAKAMDRNKTPQTMMRSYDITLGVPILDNGSDHNLRRRIIMKSFNKLLDKLSTYNILIYK